jgi:hypothetical protein
VGSSRCDSLLLLWEVSRCKAQNQYGAHCLRSPLTPLLNALCARQASRSLGLLRLSRCALAGGGSKCFHLILLAVLEEKMVVPVISSSVPDLDVEMPRYKDAAPFLGCSSCAECAESDDSQVR